jgi:hypothetical protein
MLVTIARNPMEPEEWTDYETEDVCELLKREFGEFFPATAKIYHEQVAEVCDVTPCTEGDIERLKTLPGPFFVIVYPEEGATLYIVIAAIVAAVVAVAITSNIPRPPKDSTTPSPNNDLADRQNQARPFGRIPDIYGTVRSTPDLIQVPYNVYENNIEVEHCYMCIGRGYFFSQDVRDDTSPLVHIQGSRATVWNPYSSPNTDGPMILPDGAQADGASGAALHINGGAADYVYVVRRMTGVNGEVLPDPAGGGGGGGGPVILNATTNLITVGVTSGRYYINSDGSTGRNFTTLALDSGGPDRVNFTGSYHDGDLIYYSLGGIFDVDYSTPPTSTRIYLDSPGTVNPNWDLVPLSGNATNHATVRNAGAAGSEVDYSNVFLIVDPTITEVWCNIVATNGCYKIDSDGNVTAVDVQFEISCLPCLADGTPNGVYQTVTVDFPGDAKKISLGKTYKIVLDVPGITQVEVRRSTLSPHSTQVVDTCQWKDLYGVGPSGVLDFGNVTTISTVTRATQGALAVKERKLNLLVTRLCPTRVGTGNTFSTPLAPAASFAPSICYAALDTFIGNRANSEIDVAGLYALADTINAYFGGTNCAQFNGTFGDDNTSFEEIVQAFANAVFCIAYRQGQQIKFKFEKANPDPILLFGHRNKVPGTEVRSVTFGSNSDFDSVEYSYANPNRDERVILTVPSAGVNPKQIDSVGVRNYDQAYYHAWREWNKIKYMNTQTTFEATQEAALVTLSDQVLIADNTRSGTQDGEVIAQSVLELQLSQKVVFAAGKTYTIFLQQPDGSVDSIPITSGSNAYNVVLSRAPLVTLALGENVSARTLYWIVATDDLRPQKFLIAKREPASVFTESVTAVNYDDRYYDNDQDGHDGTIPENPHPTT